MLDVTCAAPQRHGPLTTLPLIAGGTPELPYTLMGDALTAGVRAAAHRRAPGRGYV
jgi:hypothetical protein